jgi:penicillin amidase
MYDESFTNEVTGNKAIAVRWTAYESSNAGLMWFRLNRAKTLADYEEAIKTFSTPRTEYAFCIKDRRYCFVAAG